MKSRIDWAAVRADYIMHPHLSMKDLAEKYGCSAATVQYHADREHWIEDQQARQQQIAHAALTRSAEEQAAALADFDSDCLRCAQTAIGSFQVNYARATKPLERRMLVAMARDAQAIGRLALGAATEATKQIPPEQDVDAAQERAWKALLNAEATPDADEDPVQ